MNNSDIHEATMSAARSRALGAPASPTHTFFVDESGHAGANYLDAAQPFHVAAGMLVRNEHKEDLRRAIDGERRQGASELKASTLLRSASGQKRLLRILEQTASEPGARFFVVMERRFCITAKLVDVFLDPELQDGVDWLPTSALSRRRVITELLHRELPTDTLEGFARAYQTPSEEAFAVVLRQVIQDTASLKLDDLASAFKGALANVERICEAEIRGDETSTHGQWAALNIPALMHLLRYVDVHMDSRGAYSVVHDTSVEFEALFTRVTKMFSASGSSAVDLTLEDGTRHRAALRNFTDFKMEDSKTEPILQVADLIASSIARAARIAASGTNANREARALTKFALSPLRYSDDLGNQLFAGVFTSPGARRSLKAVLGV
ncbi:MAG: DUF3800 domain-containing protein [Pseudomonadota bacterium]